MNILDKIKNNWNHKESVEKNVIRFSNEQEQRQRRIKKWYPLFIGLFIIACLVFPINPLVGICLMIGGVTFGSEYIFNNSSTSDIRVAALDSTHFVIAYVDDGNQYYGTCIIGTISNDNEISYGNEYTFTTFRVSSIVLEVIDSTHFIVGYRRDSPAPYYTYCKIGTIAEDSSITYGRQYIVSTQNSSTYQLKMIDSTHFIVGYRFDSSEYSLCKIGTIAGDYSITFGSEYALHSNRADSPHFELLDSTHIVASYVDVYNSYKKYSIIGVIANDDEITFQTRYEIPNGVLKKIDSTHYLIASGNRIYIATVDYNDYSITYGNYYSYSSTYVDSINVSIIMLNDNQFIITYRIESNYYGYCKIGTIAEDYSIIFSDEYLFNNANTQTLSSSLIDSTHFAITYADNGNLGYGTAIVGIIELSTFIPRTTWF